MAHCPKLNTLNGREQHELLSKAVGENFAYKIWNVNNGHFIDKNSRGESSELFHNILAEVGDLELAVKIKSRIYTNENLSKWHYEEPPATDDVITDLIRSNIRSYELKKDIEKELQTDFEMFAGTNIIGCEGICNTTSRQASRFLAENGIDSFSAGLEGTNIAVSVPSPIGDYTITHYVAAAAINGQVYIYDMPQSEFIDQSFRNKGYSDNLKLRQTYKPRLIPLTVEEIMANYELPVKDAVKFIRRVLDSSSYNYESKLTYDNFRQYLQQKIEDADEYISNLESQLDEEEHAAEDSLTYDEIKGLRHSDSYDLEFRNGIAKELLNNLEKGLSKKDAEQLEKFFKNKLRLKTRNFLPKKDEPAMNIKSVIKNILPHNMAKRFMYLSLDEIGPAITEYLQSDDFLSDLWENYAEAYSNRIENMNALEKYTFTERFIKGFISRARERGIQKTLDSYGVYDRYKLEQFLKYYQKAQKIKDEKKLLNYLDKAVKMFPMKSFFGIERDVIKKDLIVATRKMDKAKTLLYYMETSNLDPSGILEVINNEIDRRKAYLDKANERDVQYSRESYMPNITVQKAMRQADLLQKALPFVEQVVLDEDIEAIAQVEPGGKVIRLNPTKLAQDTLGHEFGHVLIDLMGGMSNSFIREAREQLKGSKAEQLVKKNYSELEGTEAYDKEIIATAIGMEAAEIFEGEENRSKRSKIARWLLNFFRALKRMFGIDKNNVKKLARQLTSGKPINLAKFTPTLSDYIQQSRQTASSGTNEDIVRAVEDLSNKFELTKDEDFYQLVANNAVRLKRGTHMLAEYRYSISKEKASKIEAIQNQVRIGNVIHHLAEMILKEGRLESNDRTVRISKDTISKLEDIIKGIFENYITVPETIIGDEDIMTAGTADVFAINKTTGEHELFDFKTKRMYGVDKEGNKYYYGFRDYHTVYQGELYSQAVKNGMQLSLYQKMIENVLKNSVKIADRKIVQLVTDFDIDNNGNITIKDVELDRNSPSEGIVSMPFNKDVEKIYNEQKALAKAKKQKENNNDPFDITDEEVEDNIANIKAKLAEETVLDPVEQMREDAVSLIISRLNRDKARGRTAASAKSLSEVLAYLADPNITAQEALIQFVNNSILSINSSYKNYLQQLEKERNGDENAFPMSMIQRWYTIFSAYDVLDDINTAIFEGMFDDLSTKDKKALNKLKTDLNEAIFKRNVLRNQYKRRGIDRTAKYLSEVSTLLLESIKDNARKEWINNNIKDRDKYSDAEWYDKADAYAEEYAKKHEEEISKETEALLKSEMIKASRGDIGILTRWLDSIVNSPDMVAAAMIKQIGSTYHQVRHEGIEWRDEAMPILRDLENFYGYSPGMNPAQFYFEFLEHDDKGVETGYLISNLNSSYYKAYNRLLEDTKNLPVDKRWEKRNEWLNKNAPLNRTAYTEALEKFINSLIENKEMTEAQANVFWAYERKRSKKGLLELFEDTELADKIDFWIQNNKDKYREPIDKWTSEEWLKFSEILKNPEDPRTKFYNFLVDTINKRDKYLSRNQRLGYQLPFMFKTGRERQLANQSAREILHYKISKYFKYMSDDATRNTNVLTDENDNPLKYLPTFFKRNEETWTPADQSFDLTSLYYHWNKMAYNYKVMSDILPMINQVDKILENRKYAVKENGKILTKLYDVIGSRKLSRKNESTNLINQYRDYIDAIVYGNTMLYEGDVNIFGLKVDQAKILNTLGKFTAYSLLGVNLLQGINNVTYGEIQNIIEAYAGEFYTLKDFTKASSVYWSNMAELLGDIGERVPKSFLGKLIEEFEVLNEYDNPEFRKSTKYSQLMQSNSLFFMSHSGEHYMQSRVFLSMLMRLKAYDKDGKELGNMLEMYQRHWKDTGKLGVPSNVDLVKSKWTQKERDFFAEKVHGVLAGIHGEFSNLGWISLQRHSVGRLGLMFRKYIVPGIKKRFGKLQYNERLGTWTGGSYNFTYKFFMQFAKDWYKLGYEVAAMNKKKLLRREEAAIKRTIAEAGFALLFAILSTALVALKPDFDDDDDLAEMAYNILTYATLRTSKELQFYYFINPFPALSILRSPAAAVSTVENFGKLASQLIYNPFEEYQRKDSPYKYKIEKRFVKAFPITRQIHNVLFTQDLIDMMKMK